MPTVVFHFMCLLWFSDASIIITIVDVRCLSGTPPSLDVENTPFSRCYAVIVGILVVCESGTGTEREISRSNHLDNLRDEWWHFRVKLLNNSYVSLMFVF